MKIFKLPDLGEGLPDATIREWYIKVGDDLKEDQPMVAMETAKALVDVPAPYAGRVEKLFGASDETIDTGQPLVGFEGQADTEKDADAGTVVGSIQTSDHNLEQDIVAKTNFQRQTPQIKATPAVRMLARQLNVDLNKVTHSGPNITAEDIKNAAKLEVAHTKAAQLTGQLTPLSGARKTMAISMSQAHQQVASATLIDEADLCQWQNKPDITLRLIHAITDACKNIPMLNNYYDGNAMAYQVNQRINIGIAVDTEHGLFVPVLKDVANQSDANLRQEINRFKEQAMNRSFPQEDLTDATILMSNVGAIAGQYATPIVTPPMVATVAFGRIKQAVVLEEDRACNHPIMPISLTFDHRPVTGGDAARFLKVLVESLQKP